MVRKIKVLLCLLVLSCALCTTAQAATHSIYENGNLGNTYVTYFRDILSGSKFNDDYIAFRSGQYSYTMVVGDLDLNGKAVSLNGNGKIYTFSTDNSNYNTQYKYDVAETTNFSVNLTDEIIYTNLGDYPQLVERGAKYEMLSVFLMCIALLCVVFGRFFRRR